MPSTEIISFAAARGERWTALPDWLLGRLALHEVAVYGHIVRRGGTHATAWPSEARIARDLGLSPRTVARDIADLLARRLLSAERHRGANSHYRALAHPWQHEAPSPKPTAEPAHEEPELAVTEQAEPAQSIAPVGVGGLSAEALAALKAKAAAMHQQGLERPSPPEPEKGKKSRSRGSSGPRAVDPELLRLDDAWHEAFKVAFPESVSGAWGGKENGQARLLLGKHSSDDLIKAFDYACRQWGSLATRLKLQGLPHLGLFLTGYGETIIGEARAGKAYGAMDPRLRGEHSDEAAMKAPSIGWGDEDDS